MGPWQDTNCNGGWECNKAAVISMASVETPGHWIWLHWNCCWTQPAHDVMTVLHGLAENRVVALAALGGRVGNSTAEWGAGGGTATEGATACCVLLEAAATDDCCMCFEVRGCFCSSKPLLRWWLVEAVSLQQRNGWIIISLDWISVTNYTSIHFVFFIKWHICP